MNSLFQQLTGESPGQAVFNYIFSGLQMLAGQIIGLIGWPGIICGVAGSLLLLSLSAKAMKFISSPRGMVATIAVMLLAVCFMGKALSTPEPTPVVREVASLSPPPATPEPAAEPTPEPEAEPEEEIVEEESQPAAPKEVLELPGPTVEPPPAASPMLAFPAITNVPVPPPVVLHRNNGSHIGVPAISGGASAKAPASPPQTTSRPSSRGSKPGAPASGVGSVVAKAPAAKSAAKAPAGHTGGNSHASPSVKFNAIGAPATTGHAGGGAINHGTLFHMGSSQPSPAQQRQAAWEALYHDLGRMQGGGFGMPHPMGGLPFGGHPFGGMPHTGGMPHSGGFVHPGIHH